MPLGKKESKRVSISDKRQITIPKKFFDEVGFDKQVVVENRGNHLVLKPIREGFNHVC
ncbi:AbrB/MazE/SpoVT family DNA-binding domain-containing protein [Alkalicoccus chagannorensis]|uniref:AbrB/MazE/SpoVT family DNA-binding domain-containing protein n=1 Tax=Alkalicoccus chagannorensis TaxID=427072 RepID=UPI000425E71E|nr:AbrB/MazE/SpoVT family DNA-binding domain-containing protein [Alkalicoccus chagannorensis]